MIDAHYDVLISKLTNHAKQAAWHLGFLKSTIENSDMVDRLNDSVAAIAATTARAAVAANVVLFCARAWDKDKKGAISIITIRNNLPDLDHLEERRVVRLRKLNPDLIEATPALLDAALKESFDAMNEQFNRLVKSPFAAKVRVMRSEELAHIIIDSNDRKTWLRTGHDVENMTNEEGISYAEQTISLIGALRYLWDQTANPFADQIARAEEAGRSFWFHMPRYRDVEEAE